MPITRDEAAGALNDITQTERRSGEIYGYSKAAPHLILWGVIWVAGYSLSWTHPEWTLTWPVLTVIGCIGSFWTASHGRRDSDRPSDWRFLATFVAIFLFIAALFAVMPPRTNAQAGAFFPILVALLYSLVGIWARGLRMIVTGVALAALTLVGFFYLPQYFLLWMAVVGGGGLILGGLWLRSV